MIRAAAALIALAAMAAPAIADVACPPDHAVYSHKESGFSLAFRPMESWEQSGMSLAVFEVTLKDGRSLWGQIATNMGTSRDTGQIYEGCARPGRDDVWDEDTLSQCRIWEGVVYSVENNQVGAFPGEGQKAPPSLLFADLGRQLRYAIFDSPGDEPWDQLWLTSCQPG